MSGQIVGEVIAASDRLRAAGLSERGFHALIAIAEKASAQSRQASVPLRHICAGLFGDLDTKKRTAERAIQDLKAAGLIRVVRRGFNNGHGRAAAPIYEIQSLTDTDTDTDADTDTGDGNVEGDTVTSGGNVEGDTDTGDGNASNVSAKPGGRSRQIEGRSRQSYDGLNGSTNGSTNREPACVFCRDDGWLLNRDGTPIEPARRCDHTQAMTRYTA